MTELQQRIGYTFRNESLLREALTHSSFANERKGVVCNERLEFLGDSILGFCAAKRLYHMVPSIPEGDMTRMRSELVCEASLYRTASALGLSEYIRLGKNEECNGGRQRVSILADSVEAVIAAIWLDDGLASAEAFIDRFILNDLEAGRRPARTDYKTQLQELLQREGGLAPFYSIIRESGPDHDKTFEARVLLHDGAFADGTGKSKKEAEQNAAKAALVLIGS